eukprot:4862982-Pyramimonas_sp.AAC.1
MGVSSIPAAVGGVGVRNVGVAQISKPVSLRVRSVVQVMYNPALTITPSGPVVPEYCTPLTLSMSRSASVLKAVTDSTTSHVA